MWEQYRKTIVPTQLVILLVVGYLAYTAVPMLGIALVLCVMELGAVIGAAWASRLRRKIAKSKGEIPLSPR